MAPSMQVPTPKMVLLLVLALILMANTHVFAFVTPASRSLKAPTNALRFTCSPAIPVRAPVFKPSRVYKLRPACSAAVPAASDVPVPPMSPSTDSSSQEDTSKSQKILERPFKGIVEDVRRKAPHYLSDFKDGANVKGVAATFFLFFACLAPAVAFGGLMGKLTEGNIGTMEMLLATASNGIAYALFSGQPLTIIGSTGPVLAFTLVLYRTAQNLALPFLPLYSWVGIWTSLILFLSSVTSLSNLVNYFTRFTDEIFSLLISLIFLYEAVKDLSSFFINPSVGFAKALLSLVIAVTTFNTSITLAGLRRGKVFTKRVRDVIADFAPTIGVLAGCFLTALAKAKKAEALPTLLIPDSFSTSLGRPWLVNIFALPIWARWAAFIPALMSSVLLFMDQNITVRLVNSPSHKIKKGYGLHLDMFVVSILTFINSLFGLPWLVAATVRSLNHVRACARFKSTEDGEVVIESMQENRLTGLAIHSLIGVAILGFRPLLGQVPLAVLMGLFLYLGKSSLAGNQMWERLKLLITDPAQRPKAAWAQKVPFKVSAAFTGLQFACLGGMWALKSSPIGVLFPLLIAALAPIRVAIEKLGWFDKKDLEILDSEDD
ncbi:hypothetical protein NSK_000222 [Nannochloropsis salina CCMP1776]|uniref:Bicarbonate transporter-like transmembrane domain-containing protein n=1 Tax=Nannochloropsis salina CCMP1776 TaxID=1027361 RepID=A0A4D9DEQ9_9STRA|nr:hypothetical protein NSK_000222 [Nannochloropsis salina CCMP1776]|eukprot:TFJ88653.1 hypothetical protein NSK_000222 [Nannochloropsis salina CCMP1776]